MKNSEVWNKLKGVDDWAKKEIKAGRLKGMTDIKPQWRYLRLTDMFGPCGIGWKISIEKLWVEEGSDGQRAAFANINLYVNTEGKWSEPIPGNGGSMFVTKEKNGMHTSDEAFKMAITDAIGTAAKLLGLAADVYMGGDYDTKYSTQPPETISDEEADTLKLLIEETGTDAGVVLKYYKIDALKDLPKANFTQAVQRLEAKKKKAA